MPKGEGYNEHAPKDWHEVLGFQEQSLREQIEAEQLAPSTDVQEASFSVNEVVRLAEASVDFLAGLCMPTVWKYCFPPVLLAAWTLLTQAVFKPRDFTQIALGIPRGHGKTTITKIFILFCILFTKRKFILVIGSTASMAENVIADVFDMLNESNIKRVFGDWKMGVEKDTQNIKKFGFRGRNIIVAALGEGGSLRGLNLKNERPDVMIFEDVQTKECSESNVQSDALLRWMVGTAMKAKSPHGCLTIFNGNMYPGPNSILKKLKTNPRWIKFITGAILSDGTALWEDLRPLKELLEELDNDIAMGHPEIFFSEVLNDTDAGINTRFDFAKIQQWPWSEHELPQGKFIMIDPSANKTGGDNVTISYHEVFDGIPGLRRLIDENLSPSNTVRRALLLALQTGTKLIVVEGTAYQSTLCHWFEQIAETLGIRGIHFVEIYPENGSKNARITDMLKGLTSGERHVHEECRQQVMFQISNWSPLRKQNVDGILDVLTYDIPIIQKYGHLLMTDFSVAMQDVNNNSGVVENNTPF